MCEALAAAAGPTESDYARLEAARHLNVDCRSAVRASRRPAGDL
jgi:hypothetical protein